MGSPININLEVEKIHPKIQKLMKASDQISAVMVSTEIVEYLDDYSLERTMAFCVDSWQAGNAWVSVAFQNNFSSISQFSPAMTNPLVGIAYVWTEEFKKRPKAASQGILYCEATLLQANDLASASWTLWLRNMIKSGTNKDVSDIIAENANTKF